MVHILEMVVEMWAEFQMVLQTSQELHFEEVEGIGLMSGLRC